MSAFSSFRRAVPSLKRGYAHAAAPVNPNLNRSAIQHVLPEKLPAALYLKSGQAFYGNSFGSQQSRFGETVFSTSITSCKSLI
jgi:carbamoyl-phosphate synthase small subunit